MSYTLANFLKLKENLGQTYKTRPEVWSELWFCGCLSFTIVRNRHAPVHTHTHTYTSTYTHTYHTHTHSHTYIHTPFHNTHTYTCTHPFTSTPVHTHTHTHTHTPFLSHSWVEVTKWPLFCICFACFPFFTWI